MINIVELEARWLRYKIKSYTPYLVIFFSLAIITVSAFILLNGEKVQEKKPTLQNKTLVKAEATAKALKVSKETNKSISSAIKIKEEAIDKPRSDETKEKKLVPSMNFLKEMQNSSQPYYETQDQVSQSKKVEEKDMVEEAIEEITLTNTLETNNENITIEEQENESQKISIQRKNTQDDIHGIILRFKNNNNPALSLFIAKKYYELGDYHNSYNYALITNELNSQIEASWIVFAKSLVKLNKKDQAIKTLEDYIDHSDSSSARILLDEILSGNFK